MQSSNTLSESQQVLSLWQDSQTLSDVLFKDPSRLVFIDSAVLNHQHFVENASQNYEVIVLHSDAMKQINDVINAKTAISDIHFISHASPGELKLGDTVLNEDTIGDYRDEITGWSRSLTEDADILFYGCNVAAGDEGLSFIKTLQQLTTADINASSDLTGHPSLGGNWNLEVELGKIETQLAFSQVTLLNFQGALAEPTARVQEDLQVLYTFDAGAGDTIFDVSGVGTPLNLTANDLNKIEWGNGTVSVDPGTIISSQEPAAKLFDSITESGELTIEAWIAPDNTSQGGPSRIATLSSDHRNRNFTLGQSGSKYDVRLRTTSTSNNGTGPSLGTPKDSLTTDLAHVVYTREADGDARIFINNELVSSQTIGGTLSNWNESFRFALADELTGERSWAGTYDLVAVYSRALDVSEVTQNFLAGSRGMQEDQMNSAPEAIDDEYSVIENSTNYVLNVLENDRDQDGDALQIAAVGGPDQGGTVSIDTANNVILYTPKENFVGTESFSYTISDGNDGIAQATVILDVLEGLANSIFPDDAGVIDVRMFGAIPNDGIDDTEAIQQALNFDPNGNRIVYLPNGTYDVSDRLDWPAGEHGGLAQKRTILQGQSQNGTIIKLQNAAASFQDPEQPKAVIWTGTKPAQRFRNAIRDLTINTGNNNPGAVGLQFIANNQGGIRNVTIASSDGKGLIGLDMSYTNEIGPLLVSGLNVQGFDYGIKTYWQTASITFENVMLENQNILGWENFGQTIFINGLKSKNQVSVLKNVKDSPGSIVLVDADLDGIGNAESQPAIVNQKTMFLRDIHTSGYAMSVLHSDKGRGNEPGLSAPIVEEWLSHGNEPVSLFESPSVSLNLPIQSTPDIALGSRNEWVSPLNFGGLPDDNVDDTSAIQSAIDSGATTVYLPNGDWQIQGDLMLRGNVRRFIGTEAKLKSIGNAVIRFTSGIHSVVKLERIDMSLQNINISHESERTLVLSNLLMGGRYSNSGTGDLFIEDVSGGPFKFKDQNVWARQLNQEIDTQNTIDEAKIVNDGGNVWILGLKTENPGTIIKTMNGGQTEVLGGFILSNGGQKTQPAFVNQDSSLSLAGVVERNFNSNRFLTWIEEIRDDEIRSRGYLGKVPLYVGY